MLFEFAAEEVGLKCQFKNRNKEHKWKKKEHQHKVKLRTARNLISPGIYPLLSYPDGEHHKAVRE